MFELRKAHFILKVKNYIFTKIVMISKQLFLIYLISNIIMKTNNVIID